MAKAPAAAPGPEGPDAGARVQRAASAHREHCETMHENLWPRQRPRLGQS